MKRKEILEELLLIDEQTERVNNLKKDLNSMYTSKVRATFVLESSEYNRKYNAESISFDAGTLVKFLDSELERLKNKYDELMSKLITQ